MTFGGEALEERPRRVRTGALLRGVTGSVAAALVLLALVVVGAQVFAASSSWAGPGAVAVTGHVVAAGLAVLLQRFADHRTGGAAWAAGLSVLAVAVATLWLWWWS
ncbi:hypothetical protein JOF53_005395 [Crossiella equi]|uniref:Uncharacterized protein n=1 Tax=Crossiella equi TaxID=130796 RepID=A0ABS5AIX7_9PSEU|nr:hypothetical protein [Crossiella equi]MBP2476523.1 hypothetical protein [Crossiella equi]